jgi:hypothetical protein
VANGATTYHIQVSAASNFSSMLLNDSTLTSTNRAFAGLTGGVNYYWRVRGKNGFGVGDWSETWAFTTLLEAPAAPVLATPAGFETDVNRAVSVTWGASSGATTYHAQIALDPGFTQVVAQDSGLTGTSFRPASALAASTIHYWRVSAKNSVGKSAWSGIRQFTTGTLVALLPGGPLVAGYSRIAGRGVIRLELARAERVVVRLHDMRGRVAAQVLDEARSPGSHIVSLPRDLGESLYLLEIRVGERREWMKVHP